MHVNHSKWISFFLCGAITVVLSWATSGCKIGDYVQPAPTPPATPISDPYTGYYVTEPITYKLYATTDKSVEVSASPRLVPAEIGQFMSNPVLLFLADATTGLVGLTSTSVANPNALAAYIKPDYSLINSTLTSPATYWLDPACQSTVEVKEVGAVIKDSQVLPPTGSKLAVSGRLQFDIRVTTQLSGDCSASLQLVAQCYADPTQCNGHSSKEQLELQVIAQDLLDPWIQTQTINISDVPKLQNYAYEISYQ